MHSPEPWQRGIDGEIYDANDEYVTDTCGSSLQPHGEDNQKRIVACVNFCRGFATDYLVSMSATQMQRAPEQAPEQAPERQ